MSADYSRAPNTVPRVQKVLALPCVDQSGPGLMIPVIIDPGYRAEDCSQGLIH